MLPTFDIVLEDLSSKLQNKLLNAYMVLVNACIKKVYIIDVFILF